MKHLILIALLISFSACQKNASSQQDNAATMQNIATVDSVVVKKSDKIATIDIAYPQLKGLSDAEIQKSINDSLKVEAGSDISTSNGMEMPNEFNTDYQVELLNQKVLSLTQSHYQFTGGAHGGTVLAGRTFDLSTGKEWKMADILNNPESLKTIAELCRADLKKQHTFEEEWMMSGTDPKEVNNFSSFWFSKDGLHLNFGQYQIASYAEGMFEVKIPYAKLQNILKADVIAAVK